MSAYNPLQVFRRWLLTLPEVQHASVGGRAYNGELPDAAVRAMPRATLLVRSGTTWSNWGGGAHRTVGGLLYPRVQLWVYAKTLADAEKLERDLYERLHGGRYADPPGTERGGRILRCWQGVAPRQDKDAQAGWPMVVVQYDLVTRGAE